jgi:caffeoyl-CoA O-methyltransferase
LESEGPFDLVFIDADKPSYPQYLDWAQRLTHPGSIIVADNCVRNGEALHEPEQVQDEGTAAIAEYNKRIANNTRLVSLALAMDDNYTDGFTIAVVLPENKES